MPREKSECGCNRTSPQHRTKSDVLRALKFFLFSVSAGIIQTVSFTLIKEILHASYWPSYLTALLLSVLYNFTLNRRFTFKSASNIGKAMMKVLGYYCVFTPVSTVLGEYANAALGVNAYIVLFLTMLCNLTTEFLFCRYVVYKDSLDTNALAKRKK